MGCKIPNIQKTLEVVRLFRGSSRACLLYLFCVNLHTHIAGHHVPAKYLSTNKIETNSQKEHQRAKQQELALLKLTVFITVERWETRGNASCSHVHQAMDPGMWDGQKTLQASEKQGLLTQMLNLCLLSTVTLNIGIYSCLSLQVVIGLF